MRRIAVVLCAVLLIICGCKRQESNTEPFPLTNQVDGWEKMGGTRTFTADNLWQYIDGDAEKYVKAGVQRMMTADYKYRDGTEAVADIFVMSKREGVRQVWNTEPALGAEEVNLGEGGRRFAQSVMFHKGLYYVRLVAYQPGGGVANALTELGRGIESRLR